MRAGAIVAALTAFLTGCGNGGSTQAERVEPRPSIGTPGAIAVTHDGRWLAVTDRDAKHVLRIDLRTGRASVIASGFPEAPVGLAYHHTGKLFASAAGRLYEIDGAHKTVVAGTGERSHTGDGGPAVSATFGGIVGIDVDFDGNLLVAEYDNWIRVVETDGDIRTVAGNGRTGYAGDGRSALRTALGHPHDALWRHEGELLIADSHNGAIRRVDGRGLISTFATGFSAPVDLDPGPEGSVYVADARSGVYRVSADGAERELVTRADTPVGVAADDAGNVYIAELEGRKRVLRLSPTGGLTVLAEPR
jgi:hypothetical protein